MVNSLVAHIEGIERNVIFRYARILPFLLGVVAALGTALAIAAYALAFIPPMKPSEPASPPTPPAVVVSAADIAAGQQRPSAVATAPVAAASAVDTIAAAPGVSATPRTVSPSADAVALATKLAAFRAVATGRKLSWAGDAGSGGVGPAILDVLRGFDTAQDRETVQPPGSDESYVVNVSNAQVKIALLEEITLIMKTVSSPSAMTVGAWARLRRAREAERQAAITMANEQVLAERARKEADYQASVRSRSEIRSKSILIVGAGLAALLTAALLLAVLATERNTRALERVISDLTVRAPSAPHRANDA